MEVERLTAVLDVSGLATLQASMAAADRAFNSTKRSAEELAYVSKAATDALNRIKIIASQAAETGANAEFMRKALGKIATEAEKTTATLDRVRIGSGAAFVSQANGDVIDAKLKDITGNANEARRALEGMAAAGVVAGAAGRGGSSGGGGGLLAGLGWGGGRFGMSQFGSVLGLAGFGAERAATSVLGIGGSMIGGLAGGALLGLGALGTSAVGMGTDMAGIGQAAGDIKNVTQALTNLNNQVNLYGKNSRQAALAQAQLNQQLNSFSPVARNSVLAAARTARAFHKMFNRLTGPAENTGAQIINQAMGTGEAFLPSIGKYAAQNMQIIQSGLQPFFAWLKSQSGGLGIFNNLEAIFQKNLPTSVHAGTQAFEFFMHTVDDAAQHIGGFIKKIDELLTKWNSPAGLARWNTEVGKLIGLFETWLHLFGALIGAVADLFKPALGFGQQFAAGLTVIIDKVRQWLGAAGTQDVLRNLFAAHLAQLKALFSVFLALLPVLESTLSAFLQIEGRVSSLVAGPLKVLADLIKQITRFPLADKIIGWVGAFALAQRAIKAVWSMTGLLRVGLLGLGPAAVKGTATADAALAGTDAAAASATGSVSALRATLLSIAGMVVPIYIVESMISKNTKQMGQQVLNTDPTGIMGWVGKHVPLLGPLFQGAAGEGSRAGQALFGGGEKKPVWGTAAGRRYQATHPGVWMDQYGNLTDAQGRPIASGPVDHSHLRRGGQALPARMTASSLGGISPGSGVVPFSGGGGGGIPPLSSFGGGGGARPTAPSVIPLAVTMALNAATTNATNASTLGNTGGTAKRYLLNELSDLTVAKRDLAAKIAKDHSSKDAAQLNTAMTGIVDKITQVTALIKAAIITIGSALLPEKLKAKLASLTAKFKADTDYAQVLVGQGADDYRKILQANLMAQSKTLTSEIDKLKAKLASSTGKQKAAVQAELTKVQQSLTSVQQSILSNLDANVQTMQSKVATLFGNVQTQMDAALGKLYYQNGALTPLEAQLQQMQQQDQLGGLTDSIQAAKDQLAKDQQGALQKVVYDSTTGITRNVYNPAGLAQITADQKALDAAQRQLDEYNLGIKAAAQRAQMDKTYATQVEKLNAKLARLADAFQNGNGSMLALTNLAKQFGIQIDTGNIPDFQKLSDASDTLKQSFKDLADYIAKITGKAPAAVPVPQIVKDLTPGGGGGSGGGATARAVVQAALAAAGSNIHYGGIQSFATGGPTKAGLAMVHDGEYVVPKGGALVGGGGTTINVTVNGSVLTENDLVNAIQAGLLRKMKRNGGTVGIK